MRGIPTFELGDDEIEVGIGIHGEPGYERQSLMTADAITEKISLAILYDTAYHRPIPTWNEATGTWVDKEITNEPYKPGDQVLAIVNGMGGTPIAELFVAYRKLTQICQDMGIVIVRQLIGNYVTSLEMQGFSVTLVKMDDELLQLWDSPVKTPTLRWGI
jgi:dihydroxyacetone kinase-like protein